MKERIKKVCLKINEDKKSVTLRFNKELAAIFKKNNIKIKK